MAFFNYLSKPAPSPKRRGVTILEYLLAAALGIGILVGTMTVFLSVYDYFLNQNAISQQAAILRQARAYFASFGTYAALGTDITNATPAENAGIYPSNVKIPDGNVLPRNLWGGTLYIGSANAGQSVYIYYTGVPQNACQYMAVHSYSDFGLTLNGVIINGQSLSPTGSSTSIDPAASIPLCKTTPNTLGLIF